MPAPGFDETQHTQGPAARRDWHSAEAVLDIRERLGQLGALVAQLRDGLPERQSDTLARIEQGIASLALRIADFGHVKHAGTQSAATPPAASETDELWDAESAEALMQAYEQAMEEASSADTRPRELPQAQAASPATAPIPADVDQPWLEARFAGLSALIERALAGMDPARSLAALDRRLDAFERRLDAALGDTASWSGREGLGAIETHIKELAAHFEGVCRQLERLDEMDSHLRELARAAGEQGLQARDGPPPLSDEAIAALIENAAERAASRLAASLPTPGQEPEAEGQHRIEVLEGLLQDYIAERRRGEAVTSGILTNIEGTLTRIAERVDAIPAARVEPAPDDDEASERDGIELESERLAEAYAAGARALGAEAQEAALDAADYALQTEPPSLAAVEPDLATGQEAAATADPEAARQELRASAMRAKLKAQAALSETAAAGASLDEAKAGMLGDRRPKTSSWTGSHRFSLLLGGAMALLCGAGFLVVDSWLADTPPAAAQADASAHGPAVVEVLKARAGGVEPSGAEPARSELRRPASPAAGPHDAPETTAGEPASDRAADLRRLGRLQHESAGEAATPMPTMLGPQHGAEEPAAAPDGTRMLPAAIGTAELRNAAAAGDPQAQFEIATRFAQGTGVAQDHGKAFSWYERAASRGLASAQFRLAAYYERGIGVTADPNRARVWYQRAAEQGHARAMHNLAVLAVRGDATDADYATAAGWFRQAAERGLTDSQFNLGVLYESGRGVAKDLSEAYKWYAVAARSGDPVAARRLEQIRPHMDQAAIAAAERSVAQWRPIETADGDQTGTGR